MPSPAEWTDFIICPFDRYRITTAAQRLEVSAGKVASDPRSGFTSGDLAIIRYEDLALDSLKDSFEAMLVYQDGDVVIWTRRHVVYIDRRGSGERLRFLPRHPPPRGLPIG